MKVKTSVNSRPKTQTNINAKTGSHQSKTGKGKKKPKKEDNTKLFIGLGVGGFFLLIIIIAAIANGNKPAPVTQTVQEDTKKEFNLPMDIRKQIFSEYIAQDDKIEDDATSGGGSKEEMMAKQTEKAGKKSALKIATLEKWKKKYPEMTMKFINSVISEGINKNWR